MPERTSHQPRSAESGKSIMEILIVVSIIVIVSAIAIPQMVGARRVLRSSAIPRQVMTQLRLVRQEAMSQRQAITFQYDDAAKRIVVIDHQAVGAALLNDPQYPNTPGSVQVRTISLAGEGLPASEIAYGQPAGVPTTALDDSTTLTALANNRVNITFQPDGSVINGVGQATNFGLYFYNTRATTQTATAVSVLGSGGRVKIWRYSSGASKYIE